MEYFHSVYLNMEKCKGCVNCIKHCPTEAIRIRNGKAQITESWCIDCGECIRRCPSHAKTAITDSLRQLDHYRWNIALPAPSLYSQFSPEISVDQILTGLIALGFDEVYEVALAAETVTLAIQDKVRSGLLKTPIISSACPAVVRLIQVKFPELIEHIVPVDSPVALAGRTAKSQASQRLNINPDEIGVWFITPCPAKMTAVKQPVDLEQSTITGAIGVSSIYGDLLQVIQHNKQGCTQREATSVGMGWAIAGGETGSAKIGNTLVVHGIHSVSEALEQVELGKLSETTYLECLACKGGCIGGPLNVQNRFVAEQNMIIRLEQVKKQDGMSGKQSVQTYSVDDFSDSRRTIEPRPILRLDEDVTRAMQKMGQMEATLAELPGLDCGSCGSPNCKALAEDIVQGRASETDCVFKLREKVKNLAETMVDLAQKLPPSLNKDLSDK